MIEVDFIYTFTEKRTRKQSFVKQMSRTGFFSKGIGKYFDDFYH